MATKAKHGTVSRYRYGCRCEECRAAKERYRAEYTARKNSGNFIAKTARKPKIPLCMPIVLCMARDFGLTRIEIGDTFGCNGATITNRLNAIGYKPKEEAHKKREIEESQRRERKAKRERERLNRNDKRVHKEWRNLSDDLTQWRRELKAIREIQSAKRTEQRLAKVAREIESMQVYEPQIATCKHCGKQWLFWPSREKYAHKKPPVFCSTKCNYKHYKTGTISDRLHRRGRADEYRDCIPLDEVIERDNGICYLCGCKTSKDDSWLDAYGNHVCGDTYPTRDHVIPIAKGGTHTWDNVRLACRKCNSIKSDRLLEEYASDLG